MYKEMILRFFREDIGGILITGENRNADKTAKKLKAGQPPAG